MTFIVFSVRSKTRVIVFAIFARGAAARPLMWSIYLFFLERGAAARFYLCLCAFFVFRLWLLLPVPLVFSFSSCLFFGILFFVPCLCVSFCFASFLVSYLVFFVPFLSLFVVFLVLSFFLCFAYYCYYLIIIIIIKTLISLVCAHTHTRAHAYTHVRGTR